MENIRLKYGNFENVRRLGAAISIMLLCAFPVRVFAVDYSSQETRQQTTRPLSFIRIYAPTDRPELWPRDEGRYIPVESEEFERLLECAKSPAERTSPPAANIESAEYRARLDANGMIYGSAELKISQRSDETLLMPLAPCRIVVQKAYWKNIGTASDHKNAAVLGMGRQGQIGLAVDRSGILALSWMLRNTNARRDVLAEKETTEEELASETAAGKNAAADENDNADLVYQLALPRCPSNVLLLDLPTGIIPRVKETSIPPAIVAPKHSSADGFRRWRIELGGCHETELRLVRTKPASGERPAVRVRQSLVYDLAEKGLEVSSTFRLNATYTPIASVDIAIDRPLQIIRAKCGGKPVSWSVMPNTDGKTDRVSLELPELMRGADTDVQLWAYGPTATGRPWRLPLMRAKCVSSETSKPIEENILWEEGEATLIVASPLKIIDLNKTNCRQLKTGRLPPPASGESVLLQMFSPDGLAEVTLSQAVPPPTADLGIAARLDGSDITAKATAVLLGGEQKVFCIEADLAPQWTVDSVKSVPSGGVADWAVEQTGSGAGRIAVRFDKPLSDESEPLVLAFALRNPRSPFGKKLSTADLTPLAFLNVKLDKTILAVEAAEPNQLKWQSESGLPPRDTGEMQHGELRLFEKRPQGLFLSPETADDSIRFSLQRRRPSYDAVIRAEARVVNGLLTESYQIDCTPLSSQVEQITVHFSCVRDSEFRWRPGSDDRRKIDARRLTASEEAAIGVGGEGETWEITLRQPLDTPFEIRASRSCKLNEKTEACLAALPEASQQTATLAVKSSDLCGQRFENRRLTPIPPQPGKTGRYSTTRAVYRYDPKQTISSPGRATLAILPNTDKKTGETLPTAWAWSCRLQSFHMADGNVFNSVQYYIENVGRDRLIFYLPENTDAAGVEGVWINGHPATWQIIDAHAANKGNEKRLQTDLPSGVRFPVVAIRYKTQSSPPGISETLGPAMPHADIPVLGQYWTAWLPPGYSPLAGSHGTISGYAPPCASPSPSQRIFGPLGRPRHAAAFDLFAVSDWEKTAADLFGSADAEQPIKTFLDRIGRLAPQRLPAAAVFSNELAGAIERPILIDARALAENGISASTAFYAENDVNMPTHMQLPPAPFPPDLKSSIGIKVKSPPSSETIESECLSSKKHMAEAIRLLRRLGLAVVVDKAALLLTTSSQAAVYAEHLEPVAGGAVWRTRVGPLSDWILAEAALQKQNDGAGMLIAANDWTAAHDAAASPWPSPARLANRVPDPPGWTAVRLDISDLDNAELPIVRRQAIGVFRWTAFILAVAAGWWKGRRRPAVVAIVAATSAVLALFTPVLAAAICSGVVLGLLFYLLLLGLSGLKTRNEDSKTKISKSPSTSSDSTAAYISAGVALAIMLLSAGISQAAASENAYRVFVPVDGEQKPAGRRVFVPEEFYGKLQRRADEAVGRPQGWLIASAVYHGTFSRHGKPERLSVDDIRAVFEIELFETDAEVHIPLKKSEFSKPIANSLLDGRAAKLRWSEDGESVIAGIGQAGRHRLELTLYPLEFPNRMGLSIPRLTQSRLELVLPVGEQSVAAPSATGPVKIENGLFSAEFGGSGRLTASWNDNVSKAKESLSIESEELLWLKIHPGSVVVDAKFSIKVNSGEVRELVLDADPRLRLLNHGNTADIITAPNIPGSRIIRLAEPCSDHAVVTARFLLRESSGVGNVRPPLLRLSKVAKSAHWLAVSVDSGLNPQRQGNYAPPLASVSEFMALWGESDARPQSVYSSAKINPAWSISTSPNRPDIGVEKTVLVTFGQKRIGLCLEAELNDAPGYGFQYKITAPDDMLIDELAVFEEGVDRVSRWTRGKNTVNIFLTGAASEPRNLFLRGHMPAPPDGRLRVPVFAIENGKDVSNRVALFRTPPVIVSIEKDDGLIESDLPHAVGPMKNGAVENAKSAHTSLASLAKSYVTDKNRKVDLEVSLSPNIPKLKISQTTSISLRDGSKYDSSGAFWQADIDLNISVANGLLDELAIDVPAEFGGPYELKQPGKIEIVDLPGQQRRLIIRPERPIADKGRLTISGPLSSDPVAVPRIVPDVEGKITHTLILPKRRNNKPIEWETRGLKEISASGTYKVEGERFHAMLVPSEKGHANTAVALADIAIVWHKDGAYSGTASFDLQPDGRLWCPLWLPKDSELIEVRVEDTAVAALPVDNDVAKKEDALNANGEKNRYRIQLASRTMPQRIEVVFQGHISRAQWSGYAPFAAPRLGDVPVKQTLWKIWCPRRFTAESRATNGDRLEHELARHKNLAAIIERQTALPGARPDDLLNWYRPWARRYANSRRQIQKILSDIKHTEKVRETLSELDRSDMRQLAIAENIGAENIYREYLNKLPSDGGAGSLLRASLATSSPASFLLSQGPDGDGSIKLSFYRIGTSNVWGRLKAAFFILVFSLIISGAIKLGLLSTFARRRPYLLGTAAGIFWWLFLSPSILGLAIAIACLAASVRFVRRRERHNDSAVVPLS